MVADASQAAPVAMPGRSVVRFRVRYAETDQMGVTYHANYLIWMEIGRTELCRVRGVRYRDMEEQDGVLLTVGEVNCRYHAPARYDDEVEVETWIGQVHPRMVVFEYSLRNADTGVKLATGYSKHVFCGRDFRPAKLPAKYYPLFGIGAAGA